MRIIHQCLQHLKDLLKIIELIQTANNFMESCSKLSSDDWTFIIDNLFEDFFKVNEIILILQNRKKAWDIVYCFFPNLFFFVL